MSFIDIVSHMHRQAKSPLPNKLHTLCSFRLPLSQERILPGNSYSCSHSHQPKKAGLEYSSGLCLTHTKNIVLATSTSPFDKMCKIQLWLEEQDYCSVGSLISCLYWKWQQLEYILISIYYVLLDLPTPWQSLSHNNTEAPGKSGIFIITFI